MSTPSPLRFSDSLAHFELCARASEGSHWRTAAADGAGAWERRLSAAEQLWSWMPGRNHGDIQNRKSRFAILRAAGEAKDAGPAQEEFSGAIRKRSGAIAKTCQTNRARRIEGPRRKGVFHEFHHEYLESSEDVGGRAADRRGEHCRSVVAAGHHAGQSGNGHGGVAGHRAGHGAAGTHGEGPGDGKPVRRGGQAGESASETGRVDADCALDSAAVDAGMHGNRRGTGHCELDAGLAERGSNGGLDGSAAGAGGRAHLCRRNVKASTRPATCWWHRQRRTWRIPRPAFWRSCKPRL